MCISKKASAHFLYTYPHVWKNVNGRYGTNSMTAKRNAIIDAATRLFAEKGYHASPVAEIARRAGVSEGAIFRHFKTKQDLLLEIMRSIHGTFTLYLEERYRFDPDESGLEMVLRLARIFCGFYEAHELEFDCIQRNDPYHLNGIGPQCMQEIAAIHDKMCELLTMGISLGIKDGSIEPGPVDRRAALMLGTILGTDRLRAFRPSLHLINLEETFITLLTRGIAARASCEDAAVQTPRSLQGA